MYLPRTVVSLGFSRALVLSCSPSLSHDLVLPLALVRAVSCSRALALSRALVLSRTLSCSRALRTVLSCSRALVLLSCSPS
jgi:hypothetical protein